MAPILSTTAHYLARRATDPLDIVYGEGYAQKVYSSSATLTFLDSYSISSHSSIHYTHCPFHALTEGKQSTVIKVILWILSLFLGLVFLSFALCFAGGILVAVGWVVYSIFRSLYEIARFIIRPIVSGVRKLQDMNEERKERRRERERARNRLREGRGPLPGERQRGSVGRNVVNINVQVGQKESDVEMGGMRNQGALPMRVELPPAYNL